MKERQRGNRGMIRSGVEAEMRENAVAGEEEEGRRRRRW